MKFNLNNVFMTVRAGFLFKLCNKVSSTLAKRD